MSNAVTNRYAEALFSLASKEGVLEAVSADVTRLGAEFASPAVANFMLDARVSPATRQEKLAGVTSSMHATTQKFLKLVFDKRREGVLPGFQEAFRRLALAKAGATEGVVESARPLDATSIQNLAGALSKQLGKTVTLKNEIDPSLMGGARVLVENRMVDFSLSGRLSELKKRMLESPIGSAADAR